MEEIALTPDGCRGRGLVIDSARENLHFRRIKSVGVGTPSRRVLALRVLDERQDIDRSAGDGRFEGVGRGPANGCTVEAIGIAQPRSVA
jgi:hypothetical protein